jgi:copper chaperone
MALTSTRFAVPDISCEYCEQAITGALAPLPGVERVDVDVPGRTVSVEHDPQTTPATALAGAIEAQGYSIADAEKVP